MRVLLIGGTGLIGTALAFELCRRGHKVTALHRGLRERHGPAELRYLTVDRFDQPAFEAAMAAHTFDAVYDMIAFTARDADSALRAFRGRVAHYVFCSTVCVYGGPLPRLPAGEDTPRAPVTQYGLGKLECEDILLGAAGAEGFPVTILRPGYVYGEGGTLLHSMGWRTSFIDRLRAGRPVVVHGDGTSLFSACFANDAALAFAGVLGQGAAIGRAYNVASEGFGSFTDYLRGVAAAAGGRFEPCFIPTDVLAEVAPERTRSTAEVFRFPLVHDSAGARADLGLRTDTPLLVGARRTIEWLEQHGRMERWQDDPYEDRLIEAWSAARRTFPRESRPC